jgi:NAD+ synthase
MSEYLKIALAQINPTIGDIEGNGEKIITEFRKAESNNCDLIIFPELSISGYLAADLFKKKYFIEAIEKKIIEILALTKGSKTAILIGAPLFDFDNRKKETLFNSAIILENGEARAIIHKKNLPNYSVFDENRYFKAADRLSIIDFKGFKIAILICEDLWDGKNIFLLNEQQFDFAISINASPYSNKKFQKRIEVATRFCQTLQKKLIYLNQVGAQDELVFDGSSFVIDQDGKIIIQLPEFAESTAFFEIDENLAINSQFQSQIISNQLSRDYQAAILALRDYVKKNNFTSVMIGMSGGIDSGVVATMAVDALGSENVFLYALPSRFNSEISMSDAVECANNLSVKLEIISIEMAFSSMLMSINNISAIAKENLQSRIRGNILMTISNSTNSLLLSTGNKSEMAVGYATIYGDMCGAFNPIKDIYKSEIFELAKWRNENIAEISFYKKTKLIPENIISKAPSAELRENQKDSDSLPDYQILDKILYLLIEEEKSVEEIIETGFDQEMVVKISNLFFKSEYKRRQSCLGVKISENSFDRERRYPITNKFTK